MEHAAAERSMATNLEKKWEGVRKQAQRAIAEMDKDTQETDESDIQTIVELNLDIDDDGDDNDNDNDNDNDSSDD
jgi:hypothetical protein